MIYIRILGKDSAGNADDNRRYWLAGDPAIAMGSQHTGLSDESRSISRMQQEESGAGWQAKKFFDRANAAVTMGFSTDRTFATAFLAWRWRNRLSFLDPVLQSHPFEGDVVMRFWRPEVTPDSWSEEIIRGCVISVSGIRPNGASLQISYQLKGSYIEYYRDGVTAYEVDDSGNWELDGSGRHQLLDVVF